MILYAIMGMLVMLVASLLGLLPDAAKFLVLPSGLTSAFYNVGATAHYFVYYFGTSIGNAVVSCLMITFYAGLAMTIWRIMINFRFPIISRITHGQHHKDA